MTAQLNSDLPLNNDGTSNEARVDTLCGNCVFAGFDENDIQVDCAAKMLDRLSQTGKTYSQIDFHNGKCFLLNDVVCYYWRPQNWMEKQGTEDIDELLALAAKDIVLKADIIIYMDEQTTFDELKRTVDSIAAMVRKPERIYFANNKMCRPSKFIRWANENVFMPWRMELVVAGCSDKLAAIDAVSTKCTSRYFAMFNAGYVVPSDYLELINQALYDKLERFLLLSAVDDINGMFCLRYLNKVLKGNRYGLLVEQTSILAEEQQCPNMIRAITEIVPSMQTVSAS